MARFNTPITHEISGDASASGVGYLLNFYTTLTTTRKDTFSDAALTTANANPVVADSSGRFGNIFMESGTYRVILTDADNVEIWDADNVDGTTGTSGIVDTKSANYTITVGDASKIIDVSASGGARTITLLPAATAADGFEVTIRKSDSSANAVTIDGNGSELIDGSTTLVLKAQYDSANLRCDGAAWLLVGTSFRSVITTRGDVVRGSSAGVEERLALGAADKVMRSDGTDAAWNDAPLSRSYLTGLVLSNDSSPDTEVAIAVGECRDALDTVNMALTSVLTKQIDATWAAGDDAGGMEDGDTVGNTEWFHVFLLSTSTGGSVDAGFDTSLTAVNLLADTAVIAAGLTKYRRLGSVLTDGTADIIVFTQIGDEFLWDDPPEDVDVADLGTSAASYALSTPLGVQTEAILNIAVVKSGAVLQVYVSSLDVNDEAPTNGGTPPLNTLTMQTTGNATSIGGFRVRTDTSSQVRARSSAATTEFDVTTLGYIDRRGRDD